MPYNAKLDWTYDTDVTEHDINRWEQGIKDAHDQLENGTPFPVTLLPGLNIVTVPRDTPFNVIDLRGRTLINLLGRDGNCEDTSKWSVVDGTVALDSTNKVLGNNGIKVTINTGKTSAVLWHPKKLEAGKYYIGLAEVKNGNAASVNFQYSASSIKGAIVSDTTKFNLSYAKINPTDNTKNIEVWVNGSEGQYAYVDAIRLYEISAAEYAALDSMTPEQIAEKYPYVDDVKGIRGAYIIRYGRNLLPPFTDRWAPYLPNGGVFTVVSSYSATLDASNVTGGVEIFANYDVSVIPSQTYTITNPSSGYIRLVAGTDSAFSTVLQRWVIAPNSTRTITIPATAKVLRVAITNLTGYTDENNSATYVFGTAKNTYANIMLNIGSVDLPFEPKNDDYLLVDATFHGNPITGVYDRLYYDDNGQARKIKHIEEVVLDGSLPWGGGGIASTTSHNVALPASNIPNAIVNNANTASLVRFDGSIAPFGAVGGGLHQFNIDASGNLNINVLNTHSGWGENYTPTPDEIKVYFNGWRMCNSDGTVPYSGTGTKYWKRIYDDGGLTSALPTIPATSVEKPEWSYYRLLYQRASAADISIADKVEGEINLPAGDVVLEVGTGIVRREAANVNYNGTFYQINSNTKPLANKTNKILNVYKGTSNDTPLWTLGQNGDSATWNGGGYAYTTPDKYDPSAAYSVTYLVLDRYLYTAPLIDLQGEYRTKLAGVVSQLSQNQADIAARVSVLEATKANRQQGQWIPLILQNGWTNESTAKQARYRINEFGIVELQGVIKGGVLIANTVIAYLPSIIKPTSYKRFNVPSYSNTNAKYDIGVVQVETNGTLVVKVLQDGSTCLDDIRFSLD